MNNITAACWNDLYRIKNMSRTANNTNNDESDTFKCIECNSTNNNLMYDNRMDETTCMSCGLVQPFNYTCYKGINEYLPDTSVKIQKSIYKQKDYLHRKLSELSCARITIDDELMSQIQEELKHKRASVQVLKRILFRLGHKQKYLQIPTILYTLYPKEFPPIKLSCHQHLKITNMFLKYIETFYMINNGVRKNLLNYNFVLEKIFQLLKLDIHSHYFNIPKGKKTLQIHNELWVKICKFNNWIL